MVARPEWHPQWVIFGLPRSALGDLAITTNGVLLASAAASLKEAGLHRVTVSLDTLRPDRFEALMLEAFAALP